MCWLCQKVAHALSLLFKVCCINTWTFLLGFASNLSWYPALTEDSPLPGGRYGHTAFCYQNKVCTYTL